MHMYTQCIVPPPIPKHPSPLKHLVTDEEDSSGLVQIGFLVPNYIIQLSFFFGVHVGVAINMHQICHHAFDNNNTNM